jgi:hypothetical protein
MNASGLLEPVGCRARRDDIRNYAGRITFNASTIRSNSSMSFHRRPSAQVETNRSRMAANYHHRCGDFFQAERFQAKQIARQAFGSAG